MQHANKQNGACRNVQRRSGCFFNNAGQCISRKSNSSGGIVAPNSVADTLNTPGVPLDSPTKTFMNGKFNHDFSGVRMHDDPLAHRSSADIHALAYTHGNHIVFGRGQYKPNSNEGKNLIAHELAHVVQQSNIQTPAIQKRDEPRYYSYTTQDYVDQVIEALTETNPVAGVGTPSKAYDILNDLDTPQLKEVLLELGKGYHLDVLAPLDSPSHANGMRTQMYIRATRLFLMSEADVTLVEVNEVLDKFGWLPDNQQADIVKLMRRNKKVNEVISAKYAARTSSDTHTQLGGLSVGNFDFYYGGCGVQVTIKMKFDFDSSIASKVRGPYKKRFFDAVNNTWDNRYQIVSTDPVCSCRAIPIRIKALETTGNDVHKVVDVHNESDYREKVISEINLDLNTTDLTMAHEFGHVLGLYDEYDGGWLENSMFWHDTRYIKDKSAIMNEGTEMRERYFIQYLWQVQKIAAPDCSYSLKVVK